MITIDWDHARCLSLYQPWASLVALNIKTIETRSWATKYRGRLAVHAAKRVPKLADWEAATGWWVDEGPSLHRAGTTLGNGMVDYSGVSAEHYRLPLGAIVATCELVDCVPIIGPGRSYTKDDYPHLKRYGDGVLGICREMGAQAEWVTDQRPYGDYSPGRFAWLLADIKPLDVPVPVQGHQGLWNWELPAG
jgi:hypothetical protein